MKEQFTQSKVADEQAGKKDSSTSPLHFLLVDHSHLDYAWYRRRASSKIREAELIDGVIDTIDSGKKTGFTIEQSVAGREYVEGLRPERKKRFTQLCAEGKFELIGTEIQQEVFLSGEEAFFWNVEIGHDTWRKLGGEPSKALYIPDTFGFPDSMPKMAQAVGYDHLVFTRGLGNETKTHGAIFNWESDDGSNILAIPMPDGYGSANKLGRWKMENGEYILLQNQPEKWNDAAVATLQKFLTKYENRYRQIGLDQVILGAGSDFEDIDTHMPTIIAHCEEKLQEDMPGITFQFGTYEQYVKKAKQALAGKKLYTFSGEFRSAADHPVLRGIDSARIPLKQAVEKAERAIYTADATTALLILKNRYDPSDSLAHDPNLLATTMYETKRIMLPVYSHDAISGCGTDDVYSDMFSRIEDATDYAKQVTRNSLANLAHDKDHYSPRIRLHDQLSIVNTLAYPRQRLVEVPFPIFFNGEKAVMGEINEESVPVQLLNRDEKLIVAASVTVAGLESTPLKLTELETPLKKPEEEKEIRQIENEFYQATVLANGSISITQKETGLTTVLHRFEDQADRGDEYNFNPLETDTPVTSEHLKAQTSRINHGDVVSELKIDMNLPLPAQLAPDRTARSDEKVSNAISTIVRLTQGVDRIDFVTTVTNTAKDHRFRVLFNVPNGTDTVRAKEPYTMTERPAIPILGGENWTEPLPIATSHNQGLIAAGDLALFSKGLPEYEAIANTDGKIDTIALTLLRCVGWLSRRDLTTRKGAAGPIEEVPSAQCIGTHTFEYSVSLTPNADNATLIRKANDYHHTLELGLPEVDLKDVLSITGEGFAMSALKPSRDKEGALLRLYNPTSEPATAQVHGMFNTAERAHAIFEHPLSPDAEPTNEFTLRPGEIISLKLGTKRKTN